MHDLGALSAEFRSVEGAFVGGLRGRVRVEVEGVPGCGEGVGGVAGEVGFYGELKAVFAYVAPWADGVGDDADGVFCHGAEGGVEGHGGRLGGGELVVVVLLVGRVGEWDVR